MKSGFLRQHHTWFTLSLRLSDAVMGPAALFVVMTAYGVQWNRPYAVAAILGAALTMISMQAVEAYRAWRGSSLWSEARTVLGAWFIVVVILLFIAWATKSTHFFSRVAVGAWFILTPVVLTAIHLGGRIFLRKMRKAGRNTRKAVIVGAGRLGASLAARIGAADWMGVHLAGLFDDDGDLKSELVEGFPVLGTTGEVKDFVVSEQVDLVYLALPMRAESQMRELFDTLQDTTASVYLVPDLFVFELLGARAQDMGGVPVFALCETPFFGPFGVVKRFEDMILASLILLCVSPVLLLISIGVKLSSAGPVLFRQRRYGLHGEEVVIWKFRTMSVCEDGDAVVQATRSDGRVTAFGAFLRRTSLDELPQFINVLQGRMSIVGPRPHAVAHNEQYRKLIRGYMWRHKVRPGITGLAQVHGWRGETDTLDKMERRVEFDLEYIRNWSVWMDIKILWLTILRGFKHKNAY